MTQEFIEKGNRLIGKYSGIDSKHYYNNWEMLMPVLEIIENRGCIVQIDMSLVKTCTIIVLTPKGEKNVKKFIEGTNGGDELKTAVFKCMIKYIEWYNEKNKI